MRALRVAAALAFSLVAGLVAMVVPVTAQAEPARVEMATAAADEPESPIRWLALGDSYSSGEGVDPNVGHCAESPAAYAQVARGQLAGGGFPIGELQFLACSGAQIPDVTELVDLVEQMDRATGRYDLIAFSIGGNDGGFGDLMLDCILRVCADLEPLEEFEARYARRIDAVQSSLIDIYGRLIDQLLAPGGHIVVLGYPRLFEASENWPWYVFNGCETLAKYEADMIRRLADRANAMIAEAVAQYPDVMHFLDVSESFEGHNLCSGWATINEWINGISYGERHGRRWFRYQHSFHPNAEGHAAEGQLLADVVKELDWSSGSTCTESPSSEGETAVRCGVGNGEMDITVEWSGRHHVNMYVDPMEPPGGHSDVNGSACLASGGSKSKHWGPGEAYPGTYEIWIQGAGLMKDFGSCDPGPFRLSVSIDGVDVWSVKDSVEPLDSKYYYVTLE